MKLKILICLGLVPFITETSAQCPDLAPGVCDNIGCIPIRQDFPTDNIPDGGTISNIDRYEYWSQDPQATGGRDYHQFDDVADQTGSPTTSEIYHYQWLDLYEPDGGCVDCPLVVYAHPNGWTADEPDVKDIGLALNAQGIMFISWESASWANGMKISDFDAANGNDFFPIDYNTVTKEDFQLVRDWVYDRFGTGGSTMVDLDRVFVFAKSRGTTMSFHQLNTSQGVQIAGAFFMNAFADNEWLSEDLGSTNDCPYPTPSSIPAPGYPDLVMGYDAIPGVLPKHRDFKKVQEYDIHDPVHGLRIMEAYDCVGSHSRLVYGINNGICGFDPLVDLVVFINSPHNYLTSNPKIEDCAGGAPQAVLPAPVIDAVHITIPISNSLQVEFDASGLEQAIQDNMDFDLGPDMTTNTADDIEEAYSNVSSSTPMYVYAELRFGVAGSDCVKDQACYAHYGRVQFDFNNDPDPFQNFGSGIGLLFPNSIGSPNGIPMCNAPLQIDGTMQLPSDPTLSFEQGQRYWVQVRCNAAPSIFYEGTAQSDYFWTPWSEPFCFDGFCIPARPRSTWSGLEPSVLYADNILNITLPNKAEAAYTLELFGTDGRLIRSQHQSPGSALDVRMDLNGEGSSLYLMRIRSGDHQWIHRVIRH